jgi:hypothetical protein
VQKGDTFCAYHAEKGCPIKSPLTGAEPAYEPESYNNDKAIRHSHNCYAYAMNVKDAAKIKECREKGQCRFHVPGKEKGHPDFSGQMGKTCSDVIGRTMGSEPRGYLVNFATQCKKGYSKIAAVVDRRRDLHYYRQDSNGWWSHKPGGTPVTNLDADGRPIYDPKLANRNYDGSGSKLNYDIFCSYMCVPRDRPLYLKIGGNRRRFLTRRKRV